MDGMLSERQSKLLDFIIKEFVKTAKPVASELIAKKGDFDVSPATIRNDMFELEKMGYLDQLHTSGGRVPTDKAYRQFVDKLKERELEPLSDEKRKIKSVINSTENPYELNKRIARTLSGLCDAAVIAKILDSSTSDSDFYKIGLSSLFEFPEFRELDRIFEVANLFDKFESIFAQIERHLLSRFDNEFQVLIGEENPLESIQNESMILAKYYLPGDLRGSLTIIGPMRMDYEKNISLVKYTTDELNKLSERL